MSSGLTLNRAAAHGQRMLAIANTIDKLPGEVILRKDVAEAIHFDPKAPLAARAQMMAAGFSWLFRRIAARP